VPPLSKRIAWRRHRCQGGNASTRYSVRFEVYVGSSDEIGICEEFIEMYDVKVVHWQLARNNLQLTVGVNEGVYDLVEDQS
jgi:hypothetical protein